MSINFQKCLFLSIVCVALSIFIHAKQQEYMGVFQVVNIKEKKGKIVARLYEYTDNFNARSSTCLQEKTVTITADSPSRVFIKFDKVKVGEYAIFFFQDLNDNGQVDFNRYQEPLEHYTYSRFLGYNIQPNMHYGMKFDEVAFEYGGEEIRMIVKLIKK